MIRNCCLALFVVVATGWGVMSAHALSIEAEGTAPVTDGAKGKARLSAIQNAIQQAAIQHSSEVTASSTMTNSTLTGDSARIRSKGRVSNVGVVEEWEEDGIYHVLIRADVDAKRGTEPKDADYRKKIAFSQMLVRDRAAAADLPYIEVDLPRLLRKEMESRNGIIGVDVTQHVLAEPASSSQQRNPVPNRELVMQVAKEWGVQFIVSGIIMDAGVTNDTVGTSRQFEMETMLFDGISGSLLARSRYHDTVVGAGAVSGDLKISSSEFLTQSYGHAIFQILTRAADNLLAEIERLPFTARVIRSDPKRVYLDAGSTAAVRVGDMLLAYKVDEEKVVDPANGKFMGYAEQPIATMVVKSVQPQFSIGELETELVRLKPGDIVRFGW